MLSVNHVSKNYKKFLAVDDLSFTAEAGTLTALIGPNGAGKTTLIKSIMGLLRLSGGEIEICGFPRGSDKAKENLAYIPETPDLYPMLTVYEHLRFSAMAYGIVEYEKRAEDLLRRFDLFEKRDSLTGELSKGMRQKVAVCCAMVHDPQVYLFDEPLIGLDPKAIRELKSALLNLRDEGKTVLFSTHLLDMAEGLCDQVLLMKEGKLLFNGSIEQFKAKRQDASLEDIFLEVTGE